MLQHVWDTTHSTLGAWSIDQKRLRRTGIIDWESMGHEKAYLSSKLHEVLQLK
jgi:hypothetical protein